MRRLQVRYKCFPPEATIKPGRTDLSSHRVWKDR